MASDRNEADVAFIQALAGVLADNDLTEVEVKREYGENDRLNVRVTRSKPMAPIPVAAPAAPAPPAPAPTGAAAPAPSAAISDDPASHPGALTSPMVGTCYLAAEPGSDPFVKLGDKVEAGQTVLIIEAMKTMNQIAAPRSGTVKRILVEDATPVEYGAPLLIIE